jgi:hypothetical protein
LSSRRSSNGSELVEELFDVSAEEQVEALKALDEQLEHALDELAEELRPKGALTTDATGQPAIVGSIPVAYIRMQLDQKGRGNLEAYVALKKGTVNAL